MEVALELWQRWFREDGNPIYAAECGGDLYCFFCGEFQVSIDKQTHLEDCVFVLAKQAVEEIQ